MDDELSDDAIGLATDGAPESETRRSLRDMGALLALPGLWVDHEPAEIATGLLSVLFGVLRLDGAYARFDDPDGGAPLETWRPSGPALPTELSVALESGSDSESGLVTRTIRDRRVTTVPLALPWGTGLVLVSSGHSSFPSVLETQLLRIAIGQGVIAIHTARRIVHERVAREAAERELMRQNEALRSLADDLEPSLESMLRHIHEATDLPSDATEHATPLPLTRREAEVLGLLAQGLTNKKIAGIMWLSDRTVERHISAVYRKIGVARRSEATAFALRHGVI
jgi:DNA-binding CsgD family transcriptional regulator